MDTFNGDFFETMRPYIVEHGLSLLGAILILIVGWMVAGWIARRVRKYGEASSKVDSTLVPVMAQTVRILIIIITLLAVLGQFGIEITSVIALLGAAALAVGLALQGTLANIAAGVMLLVLRPFRIGDVVDIGGTLGVVDEIKLFTTEMHTFDNIGISMPNSKVWGDKIENYNRYPIRRVDMEFGISYSDDMDKAIQLIREVLEKDERVLKEPEPLIAVAGLGDSSVNIRVRPWTESSNVWPLRYDITKKIKESFDQNDVTIPFPQRDVHLYKERE